MPGDVAWKIINCPLGNYINCEKYSITNNTVDTNHQVRHIEELIRHLSHNFTVLLQEAGVMMVLTAADGRLLYATAEKHLFNSFMTGMYSQGANWHEPVLGNISLAAKRLGITRSTLYKKLDHLRLDKTGEGLLV